MSVDVPRVVLLSAGIIVGVGVFVFAPALGDRADAFNNAVLTVFSVLAGIQIAVFAVLGAIDPTKFRLGTSVNSARRSIMLRRWRQFFLFYCYLIVMLAIILNQAFDFGWGALVLERGYVALSLSALIWSLGLPVALSSMQHDVAD